MTTSKVRGSGDLAADAEQEMEADLELFIDLDGLQSHGINAADIKVSFQVPVILAIEPVAPRATTFLSIVMPFILQKLQAAGICTLRGLQMITKKKLCSIKGLSENKVDKIKEASVKLSRGGVGFITALQVRFHEFRRRGGGWLS